MLLPGIDSEKAVAALDLRGVAVSGGAACTSREHRPSHVYRALGLSERDAACVLRISVGRHTTREETDEAAEIITELCQ